MKLQWDKFSLDFSRKTHIMGILNITPDSFSDGGMHFDKSAAIDHALRMIENGADLLDIVVNQPDPAPSLFHWMKS